MHHHNRPYLEAMERERGAAAMRRWPRTDGCGLDAVVSAAAEGEPGAWSELVTRFSARLRAAARAYRLSTMDVDDVAQTAWLRLFEHIDSVRDPAALGAWLETVARRESLRVIRTTRRETLTDADPRIGEAVDGRPHEELIAGELRAVLAAAVKRLPCRQRQLVDVLLADEHASYAEIAEQLRMPIGSIGPTRARGLERLAQDEALTAVS